MHRFLLLLVLSGFAFLGLQRESLAQIYSIEFTDEKAAKKYKKHLMSVNGRDVVVGEAISGLTYDAEKNQIILGARIELFVADPRDPSKVPYRLKNGERVSGGKRGQVGIPREQIAFARRHLTDQSLYGLAQEYELRTAGIEGIRSELRARDSGSAAWFVQHQRLVSELEKLRTWLASTAFPDAAEKLDKEIQRELKVVEKAAVEERGRRGQDSVHQVETPADLVAASQEITGGRVKHGVVESEHVRITYAKELVSDGMALDLLRLAERLIDGFRAEFVDPWLSDDYPDRIPDRLFQEFWFGLDDVGQHEQFMVRYYKQNWGNRREERLKAAGTWAMVGSPRVAVNYWRVRDGLDMEGLITHGMGHTLSNLHYYGGLSGMQQDWLAEGVGYYLSLEYLGRNNVTCMGFHEPKKGGYVQREEEKKERGEKPVQLGLRDFFNRVALEDGRRIDVMAMKILYELDQADLSKSWSFFDYLARKQGLKGQLFLRAATKYSHNRRTFLNQWRKDANVIFAVEGQDVFKWIDDQWRLYAERGQDTSETGGRKR